jgi:hypothetical protein
MTAGGAFDSLVGLLTHRRTGDSGNREKGDEQQRNDLFHHITP